jgi:uncharacterized protein (TIGR03435 family)
MIELAWRVEPFQISGGPAWLDSTRYDVIAKREGKFEPNEQPLMIQSLLKDRFQLAIHRDTRELPVYALVVVRRDGKLGPGLTDSKEGSCTPPDPTKPPPEPPTQWCGWITSGRRELIATSVRVSDLAPTLSRLLGRTVVDKTALTGKFDIKLEWAADETVQPTSDGAMPPVSDTASPSIFTAFQEQLGLRIESQKGPVEILVVNRAERPSAN